MNRLQKLSAVAFATFFIASAHAQNAGTVTNHAFALGKGAGTTGYTSLLCGSAQLAVGQSAADPICKTITGDATLSAAGAVTLATVNANVGSFGSATNCTALTVNAKGLITAASATTCTPAIGSITGLGTGVAAWLATPTSANLRAALTDEVGTGAAYFVGGALGTPASATLTNATGLPPSGLTSQGAYTFLGNNTGSSASPTAVDIAALTTKASPGAGDYVMVSDQAAAGAWKKVTVSSLGGGGSGVSSLNGQTGALVSYFPPQGRLTLASATPVMAASQAAKTTVYYTPYAGNMVPIYDGTNMVPTVVGEISVATTDTTKNPAAIGASKVNDWFVWNDSGTLRLSHSPDWTNDTTRGFTLTMVNGVLLNTSAITNGPGASRGTWVGTTRSNGSSSIDYNFGAAASGGSAAFLGVWNAYNRVKTCTTVTDNGASYTYATATVRQARASAGNQISFVLGSQEDGVQFTYSTRNIVTTTAGNATETTVGFDSTTTFAIPGMIAQSSGASITIGGTSSGSWNAAIGMHTLTALENANAGNTATFNAGANNALSACIRN